MRVPRNFIFKGWFRQENLDFREIVVVRIFNATRHPRHVEAAAIAMMYMYLYSLAFMDHSCTLGAAVCHLVGLWGGGGGRGWGGGGGERWGGNFLYMA